MSVTVIIIAIAAIAFFGLVFAAVNVFSTRLTAKQIAEDPDVRNHVDPEHRDDDFPVTAEF